MTKIGIELMEGITAFFTGDFSTSISILHRIMPHLQTNIQAESSALIIDLISRDLGRVFQLLARHETFSYWKSSCSKQLKHSPTPSQCPSVSQAIGTENISVLSPSSHHHTLSLLATTISISKFIYEKTLYTGQLGTEEHLQTDPGGGLHQVGDTVSPRPGQGDPGPEHGGQEYPDSNTGQPENTQQDIGNVVTVIKYRPQSVEKYRYENVPSPTTQLELDKNH